MYELTITGRNGQVITQYDFELEWSAVNAAEWDCKENREWQGWDEDKIQRECAELVKTLYVKGRYADYQNTEYEIKEV